MDGRRSFEPGPRPVEPRGPPRRHAAPPSTGPRHPAARAIRARGPPECDPPPAAAARRRAATGAGWCWRCGPGSTPGVPPPVPGSRPAPRATPGRPRRAPARRGPPGGCSRSTPRAARRCRPCPARWPGWWPSRPGGRLAIAAPPPPARTRCPAPVPRWVAGPPLREWNAPARPAIPPRTRSAAGGGSAPAPTRGSPAARLPRPRPGSGRTARDQAHLVSPLSSFEPLIGE